MLPTVLRMQVTPGFRLATAASPVIMGMVKKAFENDMHAVKSYCAVSQPCDHFRLLNVDIT